MNILRDNDSREDLLGQWMDLIDDKNETELLTIDKLRILLSGICEYLEDLNERSLQTALDLICDNSKPDSDARTDLERSFYLFIKATNTVLSSKNGLSPHVLFALDNIIRRVAEHLVGLIRTDFIPAVNAIVPITPSDISSSGVSHVRTPLFLGAIDGTNEEITRLHQKYSILIQSNRNQLNRLISVENDNSVTLNELLTHETSSNPSIFRQLFEMIISTISKAIGMFLPVEISPTAEDMDSDNVTTPVAEEQKRSFHISPMAAASTQITRSQSLIAIEQEHDQLLKSMIDNRTRLNQLLNSSNI
jgi:hypothetical protein